MRDPGEISSSSDSCPAASYVSTPLMLLSGVLGAYGLIRRKPSLATTAALGVLGAVAIKRGAEHAGMEQDRPYEAVASFAIRCSAQRGYQLWRDFENLPRFMRHLQSVTMGKDFHSRWTAAGPFGSKLSWKAEIVDDVENERISWRSLPGSMVSNMGQIEFRPGLHEGSIIATLRMHYSLPGGAVGKAFATIFGKHPEFTVREDLRRFKAFVEAGEIPTTAGQPHGPRGIHGHLQHMLLRETSNMARPEKQKRTTNVEPIRRIA